MNAKEFFTYSFAPNVGSLDRLFRIVSGLLIALSPWLLFSAPVVPSTVLTVFGIAWMMTGILSRCGMYYLLGKSSRPQPIEGDEVAS